MEMLSKSEKTSDGNPWLPPRLCIDFGLIGMHLILAWILGIRVIYGHSHIYLNLGICLGCKIQVSDLASFVDVIDVHVYFWCHPLFLIFYHIA